MAICQNSSTIIKLGSIFPNESLNTEFKKFTVDKRSDIVQQNLKKFNKFFISGIMGKEMNNIIFNIILEYIHIRVPKYTTCFFNMNAPFSHSESFFFIGIDDDGIINGIPFNFDHISKEELCGHILSAVKNSIENNIQDNLISLDEIISCIETYVINFDMKKKHFLGKISTQNLEEIQTLETEIKKLNTKLEEEQKNKTEMNLLVDSLVITEFKNNSQINDKILKYIITSKDFPIYYDDQNPDHLGILHSIMMDFNTQKYDRNYKQKIEKFRGKSIDDIDTNNKEIVNILGTYLHDNIKKLVERVKNKSLILFSGAKKNLKETTDIINKKKERRDNLYYTFDTHYNTISKHSSYIMIKIKFNIYKYHNLMKKHHGYINHESHLLSYTITEKNNKGEEVKKQIISQRRLKYIGNRLDPECMKL